MSKKDRISQLFKTNIGTKFSSYNMHSLFGSSFRSRVSDINADPDRTFRIRNAQRNGESWYWAESIIVPKAVEATAELVAV